MKTALIDRSLVGMQFLEITKNSDVFMYVCSLLEAGVDYIEVDLKALMRLPKPNGSENYIFRVESKEEIIVANAFPFRYAVVPLRLSYLISKIDIPVILEIQIGDVDLLALMQVVSENIDLTKVDLIRFTSDFQQEPNELAQLLKKFRTRYPLPVDFCPTDQSMTALSAAITAYAAKTNSVTLSFGSRHNYASLEEFLITLSTMYKVVINKNYISGICKAAVISTLIGSLSMINLNLLMRHYHLSPRRINLVDEKSGEQRRVKKSADNLFESVTRKRLHEMELDDEAVNQIVEIMKACNMDLFEGDKTEDFCLN